MFERECGFTDKELEIFRLRGRGKSILEIAFILTEESFKCKENRIYNDKYVEKQIRHIKDKILKIL